MKFRSLFSLLLAVAACAFFTTRVQAQSNQDPDFSNVNDILHGNRTLLQITDIKIFGLSNNGNLYAADGRTSNSSISPIGITASSQSPSSMGIGINSFSGWMFNDPSATQIEAVSAPGVGAWTFMFHNQPFQGESYSLASASPTVITGGAMADFNLDGYDDFAFSYDDGTIVVATAVDVNDWTKGFTLGPSAKLDVLSGAHDTAIAAGDFNGDGHAEIAGLSILSNGGLKLVVYSVDPGTLAITPASSLVLTTPYANSDNPITHVAIARGKFNTRDHDQLAVAFATDAGQSTETVEIVDFAPNSLTPIEVNDALPLSSVAVVGGWIQVKTGQFAFPNPYDQIVFNSTRPAGSGAKFFEVISVDPISLALTANPGVDYDGQSCGYGIDVGNFDHQQADPVNPGKPHMIQMPRLP
jgi:hypothetical protein